MQDPEIALLLSVSFGLAVAMTGIIWIFQRATLLPRDIPTSLDLIMSRRDRVAIHDSFEPLIPMPTNLRARDEMVAWMTKELPKLTQQIVDPR